MLAVCCPLALVLYSLPSLRHVLQSHQIHLVADRAPLHRLVHRFPVCICQGVPAALHCLVR